MRSYLSHANETGVYISEKKAEQRKQVKYITSTWSSSKRERQRQKCIGEMLEININCLSKPLANVIWNFMFWNSIVINRIRTRRNRCDAKKKAKEEKPWITATESMFVDLPPTIPSLKLSPVTPNHWYTEHSTDLHTFVTCAHYL